MKFNQLLDQRDMLLRQARLANVAFAFHRLGEFIARFERARLRGAVTLRAGDSTGSDRPWPTLVAEEASQAVLEEHLLDEDVIELADILAFLRDGKHVEELRFRLEDLRGHFLPRLQRELELGAVLPRSARRGGETAGPQR